MRWPATADLMANITIDFYTRSLECWESFLRSVAGHAMTAAGLKEVRFRFDFEGSKVVAQN